MAVNVSGEELVRTQEKSRSTMARTGTQSDTGARERVPSRQRRKWKFRGTGSRSVILILIWEFFFSCTMGLQLENVYHFKLQGDWKFFLGLTMLFGLAPIVSILAEVTTSRHKRVRFTLKASWMLAVTGCIISVSEGYLLVPDSVLSGLKLCLIFVLQILLNGVFLVSAVPLGMDQIVTGSSSEVSSFIVWLVWVTTCGAGITVVGEVWLHSCTRFQPDEVYMIMSLVPVILLSVGLILDLFLSHKLVREPVTVNPVTLIFKVLKYAAKHKYPAQGSAFTYCENELPSRLDNGKSKYGGPFTNEQVEDVKTFWRILLVFCIVSLLCLPLAPQLVASVTANLPPENCVKYVLNAIRGILLPSMILIPLYELLVYPCLRYRGPRILQSVGIGAAALILLSLYGLTAETVQYFHSNGTTQCLFKDTNVCIISYIPYSIILSFATLVLLKSSIGFVCAQAPYNMRSLLLGLSFTIMAILIVCGTVISEVWGRYITALDSSRYGIWFYLTTLVLSVVSSVLLGCVARWYKARERDDIAGSQNMVEEINNHVQEPNNNS